MSPAMIPHRADGGQGVRTSSAHLTASRGKVCPADAAGCRSHAAEEPPNRPWQLCVLSIIHKLHGTRRCATRGRVMNHADGLVASVLERPADPAPWLILADWLEEQGGPDDLARAELLRLRSAYASDQAWEDQADERAAAILEARPSLVGPLQPLLSLQFRVLASP